MCVLPTRRDLFLPLDTDFVPTSAAGGASRILRVRRVRGNAKCAKHTRSRDNDVSSALILPLPPRNASATSRYARFPLPVQSSVLRLLPTESVQATNSPPILCLRAFTMPHRCQCPVRRPVSTRSLCLYSGRRQHRVLPQPSGEAEDEEKEGGQPSQ